MRINDIWLCRVQNVHGTNWIAVRQCNEIYGLKLKISLQIPKHINNNIDTTELDTDTICDGDPHEKTVKIKTEKAK